MVVDTDEEHDDEPPPAGDSSDSSDNTPLYDLQDRQAEADARNVPPDKDPENEWDGDVEAGLPPVAGPTFNFWPSYQRYRPSWPSF